ncbi:hypothetical protein [Streptomyces spiramenti]|uniref:Lipoprotein n=1 Tax=Streptomyces spiramenti TaxID=2720606 RepID=A0ABX1AIX9_9ACTN|nr:hypothetical protein [Streptomyces spiramenti]NJP65055.1 hypothetical protein [Streptomyces spiramenti]
MKRHLVLPVVAAATAGLLLTSCSSGDSEPDDDIAGAQTSAPPEEPDDEGSEGDADSDAEEPDDDIDRPEIELPEDMTKEFEDVDTDDSVELAVLADQERYASAVDEAIADGEAGSALSFYATGEGYISALDLVSGFHEDGYRVGGSTRYYNRSVTLRDSGIATSSYCVDFSNAYSVDVETGEEFPEGDEQGLYSFRQVLNEAGVWQVDSWTAASGGDSCD